MATGLAQLVIGGLGFAVILGASCSSAGETGEAIGSESTRAPSGSTEGPSTSPALPPTRSRSEPIGFVGRFDTSDPAGPIATWPGSRILTQFEGTTVSVKLIEKTKPWMWSVPSRWEVAIDDGARRPLVMIDDGKPHHFELATDLPRGRHVVELYKITEAAYGTTQFLGFDFHDGIPLPPPPTGSRRIEVMGDSQSTGYGVLRTDATTPACPGAELDAGYEDFRLAWGARLGAMFDADVHAIVCSGKGLMSSVVATDHDPLRAYYARTDPNRDAASDGQRFDLTSWIPDVIVLTQGAVDLNLDRVSYADFRAAYRDFVVNVLRARGPSIHIVLGTLGTGGQESIARIAHELKVDRAAAGDPRIHVFEASPFAPGETIPCDRHGTAAWHQRIADELGALIRREVGWP